MTQGFWSYVVQLVPKNAVARQEGEVEEQHEDGRAPSQAGVSPCPDASGDRRARSWGLLIR